MPRDNPASHTYLHRSGSPAKRLDIALTGDGYAEQDMGLFHEAADSVAECILDTEPFHAYRGLINIVRRDIISPESGITSPKRGVRRRTALGMRHDFLSQHGINTYRPWRVGRALRGVPWDVALVLANTGRRAGQPFPGFKYAVSYFPPSGGDRLVAAGSLEPEPGPETCGYSGAHSAGPPFDPGYPGTWAEYAAETAVHELGHVCGGLGDEYSDSVAAHTGSRAIAWTAKAAITCMRQCERLGVQWYPNVSLLSTHVPWQTWLGPPSSSVGVVEGALLTPVGAYKPTERCKMARERDPFCPVCREAIVRRGIYRYACPAELHVEEVEDGFLYRVTCAEHVENLDISWHIDGREVPEAHGRLELKLSDTAGRVRVRVTDQTPWVRGCKPVFELEGRLRD